MRPFLFAACAVLASACLDTTDPTDAAPHERASWLDTPDPGEAYGPCLADGTCPGELGCVAIEGADFCAPPCEDADQCRREADTDHLPIGHVFACVAGYCDVACKEAEHWCMEGQACVSTAGGRNFCAWPEA